MSVNNEAHAIEKCLESVKGLVDYISIIDTGSTDNTVAIIEAFIEKEKIPGIIHHQKCRNRNESRTAAANAARKWLKKRGESLEGIYFLFLDADMVVRQSPSFDKGSLMADGYFLARDCFPKKLFLLKAALPCENRGALFDYWACPNHSRLDDLSYLSVEDGEGEKEKKLGALLTALEKEPRNLACMVCLADTYKSLGVSDLAAKWYQKRCECEEKGDGLFHSRLMLGQYFEEKHEGEKAVREYLKAMELNPERAEPFYRLARYYRLNGDNNLCTHYAMQGKANYLLDEELSIAAFYTPHKNLGFEAINRLLVNKDIPKDIKNNALNNALFYVRPLKATYIPVDIIPPKINATENYNPLNPSIQKTETGYDIICRTVNFGQEEAKHYWSRDPNNPKIDTRNFLIKTDKAFKRLSQEELIEEASYPRFPCGYTTGIEDCRLFSFRGANWLTCCLYDANPSNIIQIGLGKIEPGGAIKELIPLAGPVKNRCEKNWLPFVLNDAIHIIYSHEPFTIYKPDLLSGHCEKIVETTSPFDCSSFRGSAGPIPFDEGYLTLVHEVAYPGRRYYLHRFVYLDKNFQITKLSRPFYFKAIGIEYGSGMTLDHEEKNVIITVGIEDKEAYLAITPIEEIKESLLSHFS